MSQNQKKPISTAMWGRMIDLITQADGTVELHAYHERPKAVAPKDWRPFMLHTKVEDHVVNVRFCSGDHEKAAGAVLKEYGAEDLLQGFIGIPPERVLRFVR